MRPIIYLPHNYAKAGEIPGFAVHAFSGDTGRTSLKNTFVPGKAGAISRAGNAGNSKPPRQIGLLDKCTSAYRARIRICIFREDDLVPAGIAEKILLRIPATDRCHFGQRGFTAPNSASSSRSPNVAIFRLGWIRALKRISCRTPFPKPGIRCCVARNAWRKD